MSSEARRAATEDLVRAGGRDAPVEIADYDPAWPAVFEAERERLARVLGRVEVHHFGSTAVPGLAAKPVIDMIALVPDLDAPVASLVAEAGYQFPRAFNATLTHRRFLCFPSAAHRTHHLHLVDDREELERRLRFRDRLRADPVLAREYVALKRSLAARFPEDREGYTDAKSQFIRSHDQPMPTPAEGWRDPGRVADYLSRAIPHRDIAEALLLQALPARLERFVDLGTGDGRLIALVREQHPDAWALGVDFSEPMLTRARERFAGDPLIELREHDLAQPLAVQEPVEATVSALAIHHLEDERKQTLFREIHALLRPGGVFVNLDLVTAASARQHERFRLAVGRVQDDPADRLAGLCDQLGWLRDAGFEDADCQFKWLQLALFVGTRCQ